MLADLDEKLLLAKILAAAFVMFGAFGLVVVSFRDNRRDMFQDSERQWIGNLRVLHAYSMLLSMLVCGVAVWVWPAKAAYVAWTVLGLLMLGKALSLASGAGVRCVRCSIVGLTLTSLSAIAIAMVVR